MASSLFEWLFDPQGLTPHGFCLLWQPGLILLHATSDIVTGLAYFSIPLTLAHVARKRPDLVYAPVLWLFVAFILLCGATHFMDVATLWVPAYGLEGIVMAATAAVSAVTAAALWVLMPQLLALPSPIQLRAANRALGESQARYRASFEQSPVPMHILDRDGRITDVSDSWVELLGWTRAEIVGRHVTEIAAPGSLTWTCEDRATLWDTGQVRDMERRLLARDGAVVDALVSCRIERHGDGGGQHEGLVCVVIDVTARRAAEAGLRAAEERLRQSQKMEAIGQLTGGVAHDFNNLLQGIGGCLDMVERRLAQGRTEEVGRYLPPARQAIDRASHLTARMLAFARRQTLQPRVVDPDRLVRGMEELLRRSLGPEVELRLDLRDGAWSILCDPVQLETALLNAAINARDAMPEGGSLTIGTADEIVAADETAEGAPPGPYVAIGIADTGTGMAAGVMERMFDPFFTTKPTGKGTGLGLSQLYGFVRQSGGFVRVQSTPGQGTTITLLLPRHGDAAAVAGASHPGSQTGGQMGADTGQSLVQARVMVVEDEPAVLALISEVLHDLGCTVIEADDGMAGWQIVRSDAAIDLLITDLGLPGMNGRQLADAARAARPGLPVLLVSGYAAGALPDSVLPEEMLLLRKPFGLEELAPLVRALLEGRTAPERSPAC